MLFRTGEQGCFILAVRSFSGLTRLPPEQILQLLHKFFPQVHGSRFGGKFDNIISNLPPELDRIFRPPADMGGLT
jgi:hypothetical protein